MATTVVPPFSSHSDLRTIGEERLVENFVFHHWSAAERARDPRGVRDIVRAALGRWRDMGVPFARGADGERRYDPAEVALCMRMSGYGGHDPYWRAHQVRSVRELVLSVHPPGTATDRAPRAETLPGRRMTLSMRRRFEPAYIAPRGRLRIPVPQVDASLRNLEVALEPVQGADGEARRNDDYIEVQAPAAPAAPVVLEARYTFDAYPGLPSGLAQPLSPEARAYYLRPSEDLVQLTPALRALSADLARGAATPFEQVRRYYDFVTKRTDLGPFPYELLDLAPITAYPAQMGWFDCRRLSALVVGLCRAAGFPARRATGYLLYPAAVNYHHWFEVWLDDAGWLPFDQYGAELTAAGRDPAWAGALVGTVDYRMKMGYLPRAFNGSPGVRLPKAWTSLERDVDESTVTDVVDMNSNAIVWTDTIRLDVGPVLHTH